MSIQLLDFGGSINYLDTTTNDEWNFSKGAVQIGIVNSGDNAAITLADSRTAVSFPFSDVTVPTGFFDIETLLFELEKWKRRVYPSYGYVKYFRSATNLNPTGATPENFIVIDLSDTANYPHSFTNHIEIQTITITAREAGGPPAPVNLGFKLGFLENVDGTDGDLFTFHTEGFSLAASELVTKHYDFGSNPIILDTDKYLTADNSLNDAAWSNTDTYRSTIDPGTVDTNPGVNDLVGIITFWDAGTADIGIQIGYNTY